jgi:pimeloyl-ACP methyl ester carboxylesterase
MKNIRRNSDGHFEWKINASLLRDSFQSMVSETDAAWFDGRIPILAYPVDFVRGLDSEYVSDDDWQTIKKIYPEARLTDIEQAGHWLHAEQPDKLVAAILRKY